MKKMPLFWFRRNSIGNIFLFFVSRKYFGTKKKIIKITLNTDIFNISYTMHCIIVRWVVTEDLWFKHQLWWLKQNHMIYKWFFVCTYCTINWRITLESISNENEAVELRFHFKYRKNDAFGKWNFIFFLFSCCSINKQKSWKPID